MSSLEKMPKLKKSTPDQWAEYHRKRALKLDDEIDALRIEVERLKGTTIKISNEGTGCCISCEAYAREIEALKKELNRLAALIETAIKNTYEMNRLREIAAAMAIELDTLNHRSEALARYDAEALRKL